ncbi:hypothetical protein COO60DRAFT_1457686 [Scenedesmus sp. NREL 46B-D3]|nr:hypothetical protein COO60DRAFT_1457686 [Scenedesmus sp. NREL 46B-D3]
MPGKLFMVACLLAGLCMAAANDIPIKFCAKDCAGDPIVDLHVQVSGCTDLPFSCFTGDDGCCSIDKAPEVVQYCYGSARNLCQWTASGYVLNLVPDVETLTRYGVPVTAAEYSCCKCAGGGEVCPKIIYGDAATMSCPGGLGGISTSPSSGYFTVNFNPVSCPPPTCAGYTCTSGTLKSPVPSGEGVVRNDATCCDPPTCAGYTCTSGTLKSPVPSGEGVVRNDATCCEACPATCSIIVTKGNGGNSRQESVPGNCSTSLEDGTVTECPPDYFQSTETCSGKDCGICCFLRAGLCDADIQGPCARQGASCQCFETESGATCSVDNIMLPPTYNRTLITGGAGCQENNCNAVAAKKGMSAACCPYPCVAPGGGNHGNARKALRRLG